jgi:hypothetical protein
MAIVIIATTPDMTEEHYAEVGATMGMDGSLPEGCKAHIAGPAPEGWRVISVWDDPAVAHAFAQGTLMPALASAGLTPAPPVIYPLHTFVS